MPVWASRLTAWPWLLICTPYRHRQPRSPRQTQRAIQLKLPPPLLLRQTLPPRLLRVLLLLRTPLHQPLSQQPKPHQNKSGRFPKPTHV
jgi:hypothetical protein